MCSQKTCAVGIFRQSLPYGCEHNNGHLSIFYHYIWLGFITSKIMALSENKFCHFSDVWMNLINIQNFHYCFNWMCVILIYFVQTSHGSNKKTLHLRTYSTVLEALLPQLSTKSILVHKIPHNIRTTHCSITP